MGPMSGKGKRAEPAARSNEAFSRNYKLGAMDQLNVSRSPRMVIVAFQSTRTTTLQIFFSPMCFPFQSHAGLTAAWRYIGLISSSSSYSKSFVLRLVLQSSTLQIRDFIWFVQHPEAPVILNFNLLQVEHSLFYLQRSRADTLH